jgi:hypothetical protein
VLMIVVGKNNNGLFLSNINKSHSRKSARHLSSRINRFHLRSSVSLGGVITMLRHSRRETCFTQLAMVHHIFKSFESLEQ